MCIKTKSWAFCAAGQFNKLVYNYPIRIPERFSLVIRSLLTQEGICFTLKPDFKFLEVNTNVVLFQIYYVGCDNSSLNPALLKVTYNPKSSMPTTSYAY